MSYVARRESKPRIDSTLSRCLAEPSGAYLWAFQPPLPGGRDKGPDSGWRFSQPRDAVSHPQDAVSAGIGMDGSWISFRWMAYLMSCERSCRSSLRIKLVLCASTVLRS